MRVSAGKLMGCLVGVSLLMITPFAFAGGASGTSTLNTSSTLNNDWSAMRGFTPVAPFTAPHVDTSDVSTFLTGSTEFGNGLPTGAFGGSICQQRVDCDFTTNAGGFAEGGNAPMSAQPAALDQTGNAGYYFLSYVEDGDDGAGNPLFSQGLRNDFLSDAVAAGVDCGLVTAAAGQARCNKIDYGFSQDLDLVGGIATTNGTPSGGAGTGGTQVFDLFFTVDALVDANGDLLGQAQGTFSQAGSAGTCTGSFTYDSTTGVTVTGTLGTYTLDSGRASGDC